MFTSAYIYNKVFSQIAWMVLLVVVVAACTSDDEPTVNEQKLIRFEASLDNGNTTKGTLVAADADLKEFGVMAHICASTEDASFRPYYFRNLKVSRTSGSDAWTYSPYYYWPGVVDADHKVKFVAYSPMATSSNGITINEDDYEPKITYNTPADIKNQPDLLVTEVVSAYDDTKPVSLPFKHLLSSHRFVVANKADGTAMIAGLTITKIEFVGIKTQGYFQYSFNDNKPIWTVENTSSTCAYEAEEGKSLFVSVGTEAEEGTDVISEAFMFLPQDIADDASVYVKIHCSYNAVTVADDKCKIKLYNTLSTKKWEAGKTYTYYLTFTGNGLGFEVSSSMIKDWGDGGEEDHGAHNW